MLCSFSSSSSSFATAFDRLPQTLYRRAYLIPRTQYLHKIDGISFSVHLFQALFLKAVEEIVDALPQCCSLYVALYIPVYRETG